MDVVDGRQIGASLVNGASGHVFLMYLPSWCWTVLSGEDKCGNGEGGKQSVEIVLCGL